MFVREFLAMSPKLNLLRLAKNAGVTDDRAPTLSCFIWGCLAYARKSQLELTDVNIADPSLVSNCQISPDGGLRIHKPVFLPPLCLGLKSISPISASHPQSLPNLFQLSRNISSTLHTALDSLHYSTIYSH